jgi:hypothetical protein
MILGPAIAGFFTKVLLLVYGLQTFQVLEGKASKVSASGVDAKRHWLSFWTMFAIFQFLEALADYVLFMIPFYLEAKLGFLFFLGTLEGANRIYSTVGKNLIDFVEKQFIKLLNLPQVKPIADKALGFLGKH